MKKLLVLAGLMSSLVLASCGSKKSDSSDKDDDSKSDKTKVSKTEDGKSGGLLGGGGGLFGAKKANKASDDAPAGSNKSDNSVKGRAGLAEDNGGTSGSPITLKGIGDSSDFGGAPPKQNANEAVVGSWLLRLPDDAGNLALEVQATFKADGTFEYASRSAQDADKGKGTYRISGGKIYTQTTGDDGELETATLNMAMPSNDRLQVTDDNGQGVEFIRQR